MNNKEHRMIYLADDELSNKIREMREKYHFNISALIRDFLNKKYQSLSLEGSQAGGMDEEACSKKEIY